MQEDKGIGKAEFKSLIDVLEIISLENNGNNGHYNPNVEFQVMLAMLQALVAIINNSAVPRHEHPPPHPRLGRFMAKIKFRSLMAEISEKKTDGSLIDSGGMQHFFHFRSSFIPCNRMFEAPVEEATGSAKAVEKGTVWVPISGRMKITAYNVPGFFQNILSGGSLSVDFEFL